MRFCIKCGAARRRYVDRWICDPCNRVRALAYRAANIDIVREKDRIRSANEDREKKRMRHKLWRVANIDHVRSKARESAARSYRQNQIKFRERSRAYRMANNSKCNAANRAQRVNLSDGYVAQLLGQKVSDIPYALIEAKRVHMQINRFIKENRA